MIDLKAKNKFWGAVEDCLVEFHGLSISQSHQMSNMLYERIESPPQGISNDVFYHADPFDVACDLAEYQLDISETRSQYDKILNRHHL
jgi:hypothetical protein